MPEDAHRSFLNEHANRRLPMKRANLLSPSFSILPLIPLSILSKLHLCNFNLSVPGNEPSSNHNHPSSSHTFSYLSRTHPTLLCLIATCFIYSRSLAVKKTITIQGVLIPPIGASSLFEESTNHLAEDESPTRTDI